MKKTETFSVYLTRQEGFDFEDTLYTPNRRVRYTFTNRSSPDEMACFKNTFTRLLRYARYDGEPLRAAEQAAKAGRLAEACHLMHTAQLFPPFIFKKQEPRPQPKTKGKRK